MWIRENSQKTLTNVRTKISNGLWLWVSIEGDYFFKTRITALHSVYSDCVLFRAAASSYLPRAEILHKIWVSITVRECASGLSACMKDEVVEWCYTKCTNSLLENSRLHLWDVDRTRGVMTHAFVLKLVQNHRYGTAASQCKASGAPMLQWLIITSTLEHPSGEMIYGWCWADYHTSTDS